VRVCFIGDSFVCGVGDPEHLGWVGRIAARSHQARQPLTAYNLGVRRQTSRDVLNRWYGECLPRLPDGCDCRVVVSFGVNDTTCELGDPRVAACDSAANLDQLLEQLAKTGWRTLVVGPPPVSDGEQNDRIVRVDDAFGRTCRTRDVSYLSVFNQLLTSAAWMREVAEGDGAHPAAAGYQELTELVWPTWRTWIAPLQIHQS
jgi:lysophospholipase L1-like esterase